MVSPQAWCAHRPPLDAPVFLQRAVTSYTHRKMSSKRLQARAVSTLGLLSPALEEQLENAYTNCLVHSDLALGRQRVGKVRDMYFLDEHLIIVTTDRQSAFDRLLASVPYKALCLARQGQVLNQISCWWMHKTRHIIPNALLFEPHPNAVIMEQCTVFPVEFVVRGYITGSTSTALWTHYQRGTRSYCGNDFPDGLRKNDRLEQNVVTPTTKAEDHDEPISPSDIVDRGLMSQADLEQTMRAALQLFERGQQEAAERGLLLVDTKYEFGKAPDGTIKLVDEIHTPDSSRYWLAGTYAQRHEQHQEPDSIDKEFLRLWFRENCDPYNDEVLPEPPKELVIELARRYITLYQMITGQPFQASAVAADINKQIRDGICKCFPI